MKYDFDVAVIGAGSGWLTVAFWLAGAGKTVALIEKGKIWGDCTNYGCIPSKALIDIAKSWKYSSLREALVEVRKRRKKIRDEESSEDVENQGVKVFKWRASFLSAHSLRVDGEKSQDITAKYIIIATGSHAQTLDIPWVDPEDILTNKNIFEQKDDIKRLLIIWGWYIGCELAESIVSLWTKVTIIQRNKQLVPREESETSQLLEKILIKKWVEVFTQYTWKKSKNKTLTLESQSTDTSHELEYDKILFALGRNLNVSQLNLEIVDVNYSKNWIEVDRYNRTNIKHIFAIGDCVAQNPQFTHWANNEARGVVRNIIFPYIKSSVRNKNLPSVLYTHQEVARVGKTRNELLENKNAEDFRTQTLHFQDNDRSKVTHDTQWFMMVHFSRMRGKVLGATIYGSHSWELIAQMTLAMDHGISAYQLANSIQAYPTKSEIIKKAASSFVIYQLSHLQQEMKYFFKSNFLQLITAFLWSLLVVWFLYYKMSNDLSFEEIALTFYNFLSANPAGIFLFIGAYALRPIILFPASFMTFMAGALFGPVWWIGIVVIGATLSALVAYFIGQIFGKKVLSGETNGIIGTLKSNADKAPFRSILMTRLLFFPYDLVNYASGFLKVKLPSFLLATLIWIIPGTSVFVLAGAAFYNTQLTSFSEAFKNIDTTMLYIAAALFISTIVLAKILEKIKK